MLQPHPQCDVCKTIEKDPKLERDIGKCSFYVKTSRRTMLDIQQEHFGEFSPSSLSNHVRQHQHYTKAQLASKNTRAIAKRTKAAQAVESVKANVVWDLVIKEGTSRLKTGEMEMKTGDLLKAVKDKSDYELKVKDQEMQMAEMVAHFASGEGDINESRKYDRRVVEGQTAEHYDPATELAADSDRRENESRSFYQSLVGNAAAPGTD